MKHLLAFLVAFFFSSTYMTAETFCFHKNHDRYEYFVASMVLWFILYFYSDVSQINSHSLHTYPGLQNFSNRMALKRFSISYAFAASPKLHLLHWMQK